MTALADSDETSFVDFDEMFEPFDEMSELFDEMFESNYRGLRDDLGPVRSGVDPTARREVSLDSLLSV